MADYPLDPTNKHRSIVARLGLAALVLATALGGSGCEKKKMEVLERMEVQKNIFILPAKEQIVEWRKWAANKDADEDLRCEALAQLALLGDPDGVKLAIEAGAEKSHKIRGTVAQVLAHYGTPTADEGKPLLLTMLKEADESDKRQIVWALVELKEPSVFQNAMDLYRTGEITTVQRLEGGGAFDPVKVAKLVPLDELAKMSTDQSDSIRQLVATNLSQSPDPKYTDVLISLVKDPQIQVAREAATGLGKIGDEKARGPLIEALKKADKDSRSKFIEALKDGIGGEGLVLALDTVTPESELEERNWFQLKQLFELMHILGDPRGGDKLVEWVERSNAHVHWKAEAGIVLAEMGDIRAAKYIGERMKLEPKDVYIKEKFWQHDAGGHLSKGDRQRVVAARMLADVAIIYPDKRKELLEMAEDGVIQWMTSRPQPHANALRFLAAADSPKARQQLRDWAFPSDKLPPEGAQPPFPTAFETAQSALRYVGWMKDQPSFDKLLDQFDRKKDKTMDITQRGLEGAGLAMLGMALRAVAYGASNGLAQWGKDMDEGQRKRAEEKLMEFIEDKTWHEEARWASCSALAWVASADTMTKVVERVGKYAASKDPKEQIIGACYAETLSRAHIPDAVPLMVDLLRPELEVSVRNVIGRAIGVTGLDGKPEAEAKLFEMLKSAEMRNAAALALMMGGSPDTAARTVAMYADKEFQDALPDLKDLYYRAFGYWSDADLDRGSIYRWVENSRAIARVKIGDAPQLWATERLGAQFDNLSFDNGPHSETRVVLRHRLQEAAKKGDAKVKRGAIMTLKFMKEQGSLMALRNEPGETGELAARAFHDFMHPALSEQDEKLGELQKEKQKAAAKPGPDGE